MSSPMIVSSIAHDTHTEPPLLTHTRPWWEELPTDYYRQPVHFTLSRRDAAQVRRAALLDAFIVRGAATALSLLAFPPGFHPLKLRDHLAYQGFYAGRLDPAQPDHFFQPPPAGLYIRRDLPSFPIFRPLEGVCEDLSFLSPFETVNPALRASYHRHWANRAAHARIWRHNRGPRPTVIAIHGFGADPYWLNEWLFAIRWFYEQLGCDVMLFTLPFHGPRQTRFSLFSGQGFFSGGLAHLNEAFAQAVHDFRVFFNWLHTEQGVERIGVTGISLGGYTAALLAAVEPRLQFALPHVPVVSLADLALEWTPLDWMIQPTLAGLQRDVQDLRRYLAPHCPLTYRPAIPMERLMIVGGVGDRLAPPRQTRLLWDHWERCRLHWFPGSHILHLDRAAVFRQIALFLRAIDFIP